LVNDIEVIRKHLNIENWLVCRGSRVATLALNYGIEHSEKVLGFILRGIFLPLKLNINGFMGPTGHKVPFQNTTKNLLIIYRVNYKISPLQVITKYYTQVMRLQ
jgi:pimeloyl-ACP methyl ester carboxylesterase